MKQHLIAGIFFCAVFASGCERNSKYPCSSVTHFAYLGYDDTICAILYGKVLQPAPDTAHLRPLQGVTVTVGQNGKSVVTDSAGNFLLGLDGGHFDIVVTKAAYGSLLLNNFQSRPDQVSTVTMVLVKDSKVGVYNIP